jgi:tRNA A-37 threonylcarbamoyl transferase component Bud32
VATTDPNLDSSDDTATQAEPWQQLSCGDQRWRVAASIREALLGAGAVPWEQWKEQGQLHIVKQGTHRTVYRVDLPQRSLYLKHYHSPSRWNWCRHLARASASQREWLKARQIAQRHVPTVLPLAVGETLRRGVVADHFLVTEAIPGAISVRTWIEDYLPGLSQVELSKWRRRLLLDTARMCAAAHEGGIDHDDFHLGNILLQVGADGRPRVDLDGTVTLYLIDLPKAKVGKRLGRGKSVKNLAMLAAGTLEFTTPRDRSRFWIAYLRRRSECGLNRREDARVIEQRAVRWTRYIVRSRDGRSMQKNKDFNRCESARWRAHTVTDVKESWVQSVVEDPDRAIQANLGRVAKLSHTSVIVELEVSTVSGSVRGAFKRCRAKTWWKRSLSLLGRDRAMRGWRLGHALLARGIATARPLAVVTQRGWMPRDGYLVTQWLPNATDLHQSLWQLEKLPANARQVHVEKLAHRLGELLGRMHAWGVAHRDLKGCNLLVQSRGEQEPRVYLLDLDGVRIQRHVGMQQRSRNLARLAISAQMHPWLPLEVNQGFWESYCQTSALSKSEVDDLAQRVRSEVIRQLGQRKRQGRPTA